MKWPKARKCDGRNIDEDQMYILYWQDQLLGIYSSMKKLLEMTKDTDLHGLWCIYHGIDNPINWDETPQHIKLNK
jgi:hypothetical protein